MYVCMYVRMYVESEDSYGCLEAVEQEYHSRYSVKLVYLYVCMCVCMYVCMWKAKTLTDASKL